MKLGDKGFEFIPSQNKLADVLKLAGDAGFDHVVVVGVRRDGKFGLYSTLTAFAALTVMASAAETTAEKLGL